MMFPIVRNLRTAILNQVRRMAKFLASSLLALASTVLVSSPMQAQADSSMIVITLTAPVARGAFPERAALVPLATAAQGPLASPVALRTRSDSVNANERAPLPQQNNGPDVALMGAGAAAVVIGLLIGGDGGTALAVGGGVLGLVGLYRYLR